MKPKCAHILERLSHEDQDAINALLEEQEKSLASEGDPQVRNAMAFAAVRGYLNDLVGQRADMLQQLNADDFELEGESEAEIRAREAIEKAAADDEAKKAKAPPAEDFTLTGSDRTVDEARARGQQELVPPPEIAKKSDDEALFSRDGEEASAPVVVVDDVVARLGIEARGVDSIDELPEHLAAQVREAGAEGDVRGLYDPVSGDVFMVRPNLHSEEEAVFVALHESAHRGLVRLFGEDLRPLLGQLYLGNANVRREANRLMEKYGYSQMRATEEVLADLAQKGEAHNLAGWERFVAFIRKWIVDHGFNIDVTDSMVEFIAGAAARAGREATPTMYRGEPEAAMSRARREEGLPEGAQTVIASLDSHFPLRQHEGYVAGKTKGDMDAAMRAVRAIVQAEQLREAKERFGSDVTYLAATAPEAGGDNVLPHALAEYYADATGARAVTNTILQVNRAHHTGASKLERLVSRPLFEGPVEEGARYVLVDDVVTRGGTMAELADHIRASGGEVVGMVALAKSGGSANLAPQPAHLRAIKANPDLLDVTRNLFGIEPAALTRDEAEFIASHGDAAALRGRALAAARERGVELGQEDSGEGPGTEGVGRLSRRPPTGNATLDSFDEKAGLRRVEAGLADRVSEFMRQPWDDARQRMKQSLVDRFHGIKQAEARLGNLPAEQSGYVAARLSTGVPSVMRFLMLHGQVQWRDGVLSRVDGTKGLLEVFKPVREDFDDFIRWMVAKRAERLLGDSKERNFTKDEIRAALEASREHEERYKAVARDFAAFKRGVLDVAEAAGLIDATTRPSWDHADWIPFYRVVEGDLVKGPGVKKGLSGQTSGIRTLKGGESALNDPLENIILNFSHLIDASMKNHALAQVIENVGGDAEVMSKVGMRMAPALVPLSQIKKTLLEQGVGQDVIDAMPTAALTGIQKMWSVVPPSDPDVVRVMRAGSAEYWQVHDPLLLRALTAVQGAGQLWTKVLRPFKTVLTRAVTAAPDFMARNFLRDALQAWTIDKNGFVAGIDSVRGLAKSLKKEGGMLDMMAAGASFSGGYTFGTDPEATAQIVRRSLRDKGWNAARVDGFMGTLIDKPARLLELWEELGGAVENASREATFEAATRAGRSRAEAVFTAKDLMDYSMMGDSQMIAMLNDLLPFFNARLQGLYKLGRAAAENPSRVAVRGLVLTLATLALLAANWDRDKYEELEDWDKDSYWHFWVLGKHFRVPKPFEVGFIFGTVPERIARALGGKDDAKTAMKQLAIGLRDQLAMNPIPQFAMPVVELVANKAFFTGRPIEGMADEGKLPHARYSENTSETFRALVATMPETADALHMSPKALEHLWNGYLGTIGMYALGLMDLGVRTASGAPPKPAMRMDDIPVVKAFMREDPARGTRFKTELYELRTQADQAFRTVNAMIAENNPEAAMAEAKRNDRAIAAHGVLDASAKTMHELGSMIDVIYRDRNLTPAEKRLRVDNLLVQENMVAEQTVRAVKPLLRK